MKPCFILPLIALSACQNASRPSVGVIDYTRSLPYACGAHRLVQGYSKDSGYRREVVHEVPPQRAVYDPAPILPAPAAPIPSAQPSEELRSLKAKLDVVADALARNAGATNANQKALANEIKTLDAKVSELEGRPVQVTSARPDGFGIHLPGHE